MSKNKYYYSDDRYETVTTFSPDTVLEGELNFDTSVKIKGKFKGKITTNGMLVIGDGAEVNGDINAYWVVIGGTVRGNIIAQNKIEMLTNGRIFGDIKTSKLKIADGVIFEGNCEMIKPDKNLVTNKP